MRDYYEILGVSKDADSKSIKAAYRKLAHKYHPDICKEENAEAKFTEIAKAYEVLKDPQKRRDYDQMGHSSYQQSQQAGGGYNYQRGYQTNANFIRFSNINIFFRILIIIGIIVFGLVILAFALIYMFIRGIINLFR